MTRLYFEMQNNDTTDYDIVIVGGANDKIFNTVELYFDNLTTNPIVLQKNMPKLSSNFLEKKTCPWMII